jgi:hypothetical protein
VFYDTIEVGCCWDGVPCARSVRSTHKLGGSIVFIVLALLVANVVCLAVTAVRSGPSPGRRV